uniref:BPTI/Kunitz inhibitor domain-containing protein n=1 Tax=Romanomermis culicivorax TaxID=13658 RepID=A0A915L9G7_ROMCU
VQSIASFSEEYIFSGDIYCYYPQSHKCEKTSITYGKVCFQGYRSCRQFTHQPMQMWLFDKIKKQCVQSTSKNPDLTLFETKEKCDANYRVKQKTKGNVACFGSGVSFCFETKELQFVYSHSKKICLLNIVKEQRSPMAYSTYTSCARDNGGTLHA